MNAVEWENKAARRALRRFSGLCGHLGCQARHTAFCCVLSLHFAATKMPFACVSTTLRRYKTAVVECFHHLSPLRNCLSLSRHRNRPRLALCRPTRVGRCRGLRAAVIIIQWLLYSALPCSCPHLGRALPFALRSHYLPSHVGPFPIALR